MRTHNITVARATYIGTVYVNIIVDIYIYLDWSGGAMVLGQLPIPGRPIRITIGQGPTALK